MNRGAAHVRAELKRRGLSQNEGAKLAVCDSGNFSRLLNDPERAPGLELALRIRAEFGAEPEWWKQKISDEEAAAMLSAVEVPTSNESGEHAAAVDPTGSEG